DVAEWLRGGLQSRLHRFDSGRRLLYVPDVRAARGAVLTEEPQLRAAAGRRAWSLARSASSCVHRTPARAPWGAAGWTIFRSCAERLPEAAGGAADRGYTQPSLRL